MLGRYTTGLIIEINLALLKLSSRQLTIKTTLKRNDTPMLAGYQVYHNYIRPHEALDGKTPAEACGIEVKGNDKWKTLIQNATKQANRNK